MERPSLLTLRRSFNVEACLLPSVTRRSSHRSQLGNVVGTFNGQANSTSALMLCGWKGMRARGWKPLRSENESRQRVGGTLEVAGPTSVSKDGFGPTAYRIWALCISVKKIHPIQPCYGNVSAKMPPRSSPLW